MYTSLSLVVLAVLPAASTPFCKEQHTSMLIFDSRQREPAPPKTVMVKLYAFILVLCALLGPSSGPQTYSEAQSIPITVFADIARPTCVCASGGKRLGLLLPEF